MSKPHQMVCTVPVCPKCGYPGQGEYYMPVKGTRDPTVPEFEFCVNHGINGQTVGKVSKALGRNKFHRTGIFIRVSKDEIDWGRRANPKSPPDWNYIKRLMRRK